MPKTRPPDKEDPAEIAGYVASLSGDLARLARAHGLETLAYLLDMAKLEAEQVDDHAEAG